MGARIEILIPGCLPSWCPVAPFVGARIEMTAGLHTRHRTGTSLPLWERGLKLTFRQQKSGHCHVAPFVGARIEILAIVSASVLVPVAPFVGARIEILKGKSVEDIASGRSLRGSAD